MTKQNKLFSWLGFGKKNQDAQTPETDTQVSPVAETQSEAASDSTVMIESSKSESPVLGENTAAPDTATPVPVAHSAVAEQAEPNTVPQPLTAAVLANTPEPVSEISSENATAAAVSTQTEQPESITITPQKKPGFFTRLKQGLAKTSQNLGSGLASLFVGKKIDDDLYEELETQLLLADVGMDTTQKLIKQLTAHADRKALKDPSLLFEKLQHDMATMLDAVEQPLVPVNSDGPFVILMVGVNGVGKTTTIGKMAQQFKQQGKSVMLAAGDTFRAAAVEQLQVWGDRNKIPVIAQHTGADSASVIFDAYQAAKARKVDILIADTAGRLQNKAHLMEELKKIVRVLQKIDAKAPHEVMLTLDAGTGQNALSQAKLFNEAVPLTGISLTKLDGTAKGGVIFAIADQFNVPIRFIGVGEAIDDLRQFAAKDFIRALFNKE
ncbi:signal recognition particle-docking protein FtsY [Alishewanella tabrizica]|uniref:Signal recognition particle receptor FtsY n=1 Tax=Alishewanella tabrizica TaxID=671278 RepID=A0ABQ2WU96_9ALTE|nr:signal recognition particle-docking protein FtsY [Alishewanella tabrizica]GGW70498.1 signal recognition particle receptor FtsY [Alishewanella tabrizica]